MELPNEIKTEEASMYKGKLITGCELGRGAYGEVFQCINTETGSFYAMKKIDLKNTNEAKLRKEIALLKNLQHPNIVMYYDSYKADSSTVHIIMEYMSEGSISSMLKKFGGPFTECLIQKSLK